MQMKWHKPQTGWYKYNADAAVRRGLGAIEVMMWDNWGCFVGGFSNQSELELLEAMGLQEVLS